MWKDAQLHYAYAYEAYADQNHNEIGLYIH